MRHVGTISRHPVLNQYIAADKMSEPCESRTLLSSVSDVHRSLPLSNALPTKSYVRLQWFLGRFKHVTQLNIVCLSVGWIILTTLILLIAHVAIPQRTLQIRQARYGKINDFVACNKRASMQISAV